eukprot:842922-Pelagomonas_calceolata.AAC.1
MLARAADAAERAGQSPYLTALTRNIVNTVHALQPEPGDVAARAAMMRVVQGAAVSALPEWRGRLQVRRGWFVYQGHSAGEEKHMPSHPGILLWFTASTPPSTPWAKGPCSACLRAGAALRILCIRPRHQGERRQHMLGIRIKV